MRKRCTLVFTVTLFFGVFSNLFSQQYQVQIASFIDEIDPSFFTFAGYNFVYSEKDHNNFVRYSIGDFFSKEAAELLCKEAVSKGFLNAHIKKIDRPGYAYVADAHEMDLIKVPVNEPLFVRSIQFSNNKISLDEELLVALQEALDVMLKHPELKLRIIGHTDDRGDKLLNQAISGTRARVIQNFLLANGIPAYRLHMKVSKKSSPEIYFEGRGLPENRDFNRRIILTLVDLKEEIIHDRFEVKFEQALKFNHIIN